MSIERAPLLAIDTLDVRYRSGGKNTVAVNDFTLEIGRGESVALIGESGCGKSTVAMAIMRYLGGNGDIAGGRVNFDGRDITGLNASELRALRRRGIAMVYQDATGALNPTMKVGRQLTEVLVDLQGMASNDARTRAIEMLGAVGIPDPEGTMRRFPHQLSGGQQQRVVIAMAFLAEPSLLILDEPTTALDVTVEAEIIQLLARMREEHGTAMLFISHNLGLVRRVCERVAVMYAGQIVEAGATQTILGNPQHPYTRGLLACIPTLDRGRADYRLNSIPGQVPRLSEPPRVCTFLERCRYRKPGICDAPIALEPARDAVTVRCARWTEFDADHGAAETLEESPVAPIASDRNGSERVLTLNAVSKTYQIKSPFDLFGVKAKQIHANHEINLELAPGETLGIVGESGCGKSTLARIIMGLETVSAGKVTVLGDNVTQKLVEKREKHQVRNVQMVFQNPDSTLNPLHTVGFILDRAVKMLGGVRDRNERRREVDRLLSLVRLPQDVKQMRAGRLSGGQKQRVAVARAFAGRPALVVADEPTSALDTSVKTAILELLLSVQKETGTALVFISHDLAVVRYIADRVCVMYLGRVLELGSVDEVFQPPHHPYTRQLLASVPTLEGDVDSPDRPAMDEVAVWTARSRGCPFAQRCEHRLDNICAVESPPQHIAGDNHLIRCHLPIAELRTS